MYQKVLQILHSEDKSILTKYIEIDDGIYVWTNTSTQYKISLLKRFFKLYDTDPADLVLYLKDDEEKDLEFAGTRYEIKNIGLMYLILYRRHMVKVFLIM